MDDKFSQPESGPLIVPGPGLLANDTVPCGSAATIRVTKQPKYGEVTVQSTGGFVYDNHGTTPQPDFFSYEIR